MDARGKLVATGLVSLIVGIGGTVAVYQASNNDTDSAVEPVALVSPSPSPSLSPSPSVAPVSANQQSDIQQIIAASQARQSGRGGYSNVKGVVGNFAYVAISYGEGPAETQWLKKDGATWSVIAQGNGVTSCELLAKGAPTSALPSLGFEPNPQC